MEQTVWKKKIVWLLALKPICNIEPIWKVLALFLMSLLFHLIASQWECDSDVALPGNPAFVWGTLGLMINLHFKNKYWKNYTNLRYRLGFTDGHPVYKLTLLVWVWGLLICLFVCFLWLFEAESHYIATVGLELDM